MSALKVPRFWSASWWRAWLRDFGGGQPLYPLVVLFGINCVDELDRRAFDVLLPEIRDAFDLDTSGILLVVALAGVAALGIAVPIGFVSDRWNRVRITVIGATSWGIFSVMTGMATGVWMLGIARAGSGIGRAVVDPTHNSLLADYYDIPDRPKVYSVHRAANALGLFLGPLTAGLLAQAWGWRVPFFVFAIPTFVFVVLALRLREPNRGFWERKAMGMEGDEASTEDLPASWTESWRVALAVGTLRRIYWALPFLAMSVIGLAALTGLYYDEVFGLDAAQRGFVAALAEPAAFVGLLLGIPIATRLMIRDPGLVLKFVALMGVVVAVAFTIFALTPFLGIAIAMNVLVSGVTALLAPAIFATLSLAIPPKVRSFGFGLASLCIMPGLLALPLVGWVADEWGIRTGLVVIAPIFLVGALIIASGAALVAPDIKNVWTSAAAQSEVLYNRRQGQEKLLLCRDVCVKYDGVQVLFDVDFEVEEGEVVALLGTNGAGKSTLLRAIGGLVDPSAGAIVFDGRDLTYTPADEAAKRGITLMPGGQGVFPSLTVRENLHLAGWIHRKDGARVRERTERVLEIFPVLGERINQQAGNLSGGQQQMLTLGMAFIEQPRLLMIDELSLGLAPSVVGQLLEIVRALKEAGTTIILVEQSVNVALTVAETAYFMEKGEIRFHGPTAELLERPDVLRSVFLEGAATHETAMAAPTLEPLPAGAVDVVGAATPGKAPSNGHGGSPELRLEARDVSKRFGGISALRDVGFTVAAGEILGFLGPNGAGKTTLFDVICGFTPDDGGAILLRAKDGEVYDVTRRPAHVRAQLGLGRSFQDGRLFPALTVAETIAVSLECSVDVRDPLAAALHLPAVVDSEAAVHERVEELIDLMGLDAFRDKFVHELSTGSRRIVDLACILAHQPGVLLLDEPSSGIAQREAEALGPLLLRIREQLGATILLIEHDLPLLSSVSDRVVALDLGEVIADGPPDQVVHDPRVVASYLGTDNAPIARSGAGNTLS
ncbi:MAG: MFS transporter [Actinobacteria bacterium]|nr:MFS transporter [Actinomycetota bacterium]